MAPFGALARGPEATRASAVATHPEFRRLGLARQLVAAVAETILQRGDTPYLHQSAANAAAIRLYQSLGFTVRRPAPFVLWEAPG